MRRSILLVIVVSLAACSGIRTKQWIGAGLAVATWPVNDPTSPTYLDSQPLRLATTTLLLAGTIAMFELDSRRDRSGETTQVAFRAPKANPPHVGDVIRVRSTRGAWWHYQISSVAAERQPEDPARTYYLVRATAHRDAPEGARIYASVDEARPVDWLVGERLKEPICERCSDPTERLQ